MSSWPTHSLADLPPGATEPLLSDSSIIIEKSGKLVLRMAASQADIERCQRLRYEVFYEEMMAQPSSKNLAERRDFDEFDTACDHIMVIDAEAKGGPCLVGTYRLLLKENADKIGGFYTANEFDLSTLLCDAHSDLNFLELGRSCVHAKYRGKPVIDLLWRGIGAYLNTHQIDVMFGCASFLGRDPDAHAVALTYLARHHLAAPAWRARAHTDQYVPMDRMPGTAIAPIQGLRALPPVIRGYVRAGASIGDGAVIDHMFGTVDVLIIFPMTHFDERYSARFVGRSTR